MAQRCRLKIVSGCGETSVRLSRYPVVFFWLRNESYKSGSARTLSREKIEGRTIAASNRTDPYRSRLDSRLRGNDALYAKKTVPINTSCLQVI